VFIEHQRRLVALVHVGAVQHLVSVAIQTVIGIQVMWLYVEGTLKGQKLLSFKDLVQ